MSDVVHPDIVATTKNKVLFKVKNVHYVFDYGKDDPIAEQYIFTEAAVVQYSNIDFDSEFAKGAVDAVKDYIMENQPEDEKIENFDIRRAEIDEDATSVGINLTGGILK